MELREFNNSEDMDKAAANYIAGLINKNPMTPFMLALSGGQSPLGTYLNLSKEKVGWESVFLFLTDERFVNHTDERSNYKKIYDNLISRIRIPPKNIFRPKVESSTTLEAASIYETDMKKIFKDKNKINRSGNFPEFDLICLGIGEDGHTASLFPGINELDENYRWVSNTQSPSNFSIIDRITITFPVINNSKNIIFIVSGKNKGNVLKEIFAGNITLPVSRVKSNNNIIWFIDKNSL